MEQRFKYFFNAVIKVAREDMGELCCKVILSMTQNPESACDKVAFHVHFGFWAIDKFNYSKNFFNIFGYKKYK